MPYMHSNMAATTTTAIDNEMAQDLAELTASALGRPYEPQDRKHCEHGAKIDENGGTIHLCSRAVLRSPADLAQSSTALLCRRPLPRLARTRRP